MDLFSLFYTIDLFFCSFIHTILSNVSPLTSFFFFNIMLTVLAILPPWKLSWWRIHLQCRRPQFDSWVRKIHWRRDRLPYPLQYSWASLVTQLVKNQLVMRRPGFNLWVGKIPWRRESLLTPVCWPRDFHGLCSPWGHRVRHDWVTFIFTLSQINFRISLSDFDWYRLHLICRSIWQELKSWQYWISLSMNRNIFASILWQRSWRNPAFYSY